MNIGAEDRLAEMEAKRGKHGLGRGALCPRKMDFRNSESGIRGQHAKAAFRGIDGAADHAADDDGDDKGEGRQHQRCHEHRAADMDQTQRRFEDAQPERRIVFAPRLGLDGRDAGNRRRGAARGLGARTAGFGCRLHRSHVASSTIQRTSAPKPNPQKDACSGTKEVGVIPGCVFTSKRISL